MNKPNVIHCFSLAIFPTVSDGNKHLFAVLFLPVSVSRTEERLYSTLRRGL